MTVATATRTRHLARLIFGFLTLLALIAQASSAGAKPPSSGGTSGGGNLNLKIQGYDEVSDSWTKGNVAGYAELDVIPFRIILANGSSPSTVNALQTVFDHCSKSADATPPCEYPSDAGEAPGIEDLQDFAICAPPATSTPPGGTSCTPVPVVPQGASAPGGTDPYVEGPLFHLTSGGTTQGIYTWHRVALAAGQTRIITWGAELAFGSHTYNGASLHMQIGDAAVNGATVEFGSKDVPIPVNQIIATETDKVVCDADGTDCTESRALEVGDTVLFKITATTYGPRNGTQDITITDDIPVCLDYVEGTASPAATSSPTGANGEIAWFFDNVGNRSSKTVSFQATAVAVGDTCKNVAVTSSDQAPPSDDEVPTPTAGVADVTVDKDCNPDTVDPDGTAICTLTYSNEGTTTATAATIKDVLDPGLSYVDDSTYSGNPPVLADDPAIAANTPSTGYTTLTFSIGDVAPGGGGVVTYSQKVPATGPAGTQSFVDTATVFTTATERDTTDNSDSETTQVLYEVDLNIQKAGCPPTTTPNTAFTLTLTYANAGSAQATTVTVTDTLPTGMSYVTGSGSPAPSSVQSQTLTWAVGSLNPGAGGTITYQVTISDAGQSTYTNAATIASDQADADTSDNSDSCTSGLAYVDVFVDKECPGTASPGATVTHTLDFGNEGNQPAEGVEIDDTLGAGLTFKVGTATLNGEPITPEVSEDGRVLTFTIGDLPAGSSGTISYQVTLPATATVPGEQTFTDTAVISTTSTNAVDTADDTSQTCPTVVDYQPNLWVEKQACPKIDKQIPVAGYITYTITYGNSGSAPASGTQLVDSFDAPVTVVDDDDADASTPWDETSQTITWNIGQLDPGPALTKTVIVTTEENGPLTETATLSSDDTDPVSTTLTHTVSNAASSTSGSAYALNIEAAGVVLVDEAAPSESEQSGSSGTTTDTEGPLVPLDVPMVSTGGALQSSSTSSIGNNATTTATATVADLSLLGGAITAKTVHGVSQSTAGPFGASSSSEGSTFEDLVINGVGYTDVAPNSTVVLVRDPITGSVVAEAHLYEVTQQTASEGGTTTSSMQVDMIRVVLLKPLPPLPSGAEITVAHAESIATAASGLPCGASLDTVSGKALTASVVNALGVETDFGVAEIGPGGGSESNGVNATAPGVVTTATAANTASGDANNDSDDPLSATARSRTEGVNLLDGLVTADVLDVSSTSTADGVSASTEFTATFLNLVLNGTPVEVVPEQAEHLVPLEDGSVAIIRLNWRETNEPNTSNTEGTIKAIWITILQNSDVQTDIVVASAHSDAHVF